jgi:hypothetical protein
MCVKLHVLFVSLTLLLIQASSIPLNRKARLREYRQFEDGEEDDRPFSEKMKVFKGTFGLSRERFLFRV